MTNSKNLSDLRELHPDSWLLEYIEKCNTGEIIVGKEIFQEFDILLAHFEDDSVHFETADAHKRIKFIETHCKHYEAPFAGKPFILTLRQKAFVEALYSFKIFDDEIGRWVRLYQEALLLVGRKCGKTPFVAAMMLAEWFCGELGTKELCSSNDYEQADLMFQAINAMREESPTLERVTRKNVKGLFFGNPRKVKRKGKFSYQNKGNIRKISAKTGAKEGKNIKVGAVDEAHELKDNSSVMPIRQALSTQDEPLYFEITTEGFTDSGYLDDRLKDARQVLKGELLRPRWLIFLYTQDSETEIWQDERTWAKSNPDIGTIKKWSFLRQMVEEAKTNSATRAFVLAKDFNIKQAGGAAWLQDPEIINTATFDLEEFRGAYYIAGNDFAETTDLCASKLLLMKPGEKTIYFWSHYWIPEEKLKNSPDDANYEQWARDGYLTIVPGSSVDSSLVADWQWSLYQDFGLIPYKSGYDNRFAKDYLRKYEEYFGKDSEAVNIPQDAKCLNNPMRRLESDLRHKLVNYNNRYGDFWCFRNTGIKTDNAERIQPCKLKTTHRIDGTAAAVDCYAAFEWYKSEFLTLVGSR
ncbi:terminase large subunit [Oscillibacter ruminantium]|uniref:terminase large subunit n=1 Tax=Oscillibacter ruminantium TaxID=1263547 RepID=UPI0033238C5F